MTYTTDRYNGDTLRVPLPTLQQRLQSAKREIAEMSAPKYKEPFYDKFSICDLKWMQHPLFVNKKS